MKKIAVALMNESRISRHFGRSPFFGIYTISSESLDGPEMRENKFTRHMKNKASGTGGDHHGHRQDHDGHSHEHRSVIGGLDDCQTIIAGGMGSGAMNHLSAAGLEVIITDENDPDEAIRQYQAGKLKNLEAACGGD